MDLTIQERDIYSISRLNHEVRTVLESGFPMVWIQAEISNLSRPASGHWYFSLKDENAQVRCAMFRNRNMHLQFKPADGQQVLVRAKIGLYEPRGEYQLIIEHMEAAGEGALRQQFEQLKLKLSAAGLFDSTHKKSFPAYPKNIGIITSPTGAAIHDILTTLKRRYPVADVFIYPTSVQGTNAAKEIIRAILTAVHQQVCDVLILTRGGGSLEDLWAFNDEVLAHTIYNSPIPIVSGIGHDVDFTIADFVADHRAATPTGAAEFVTPDNHDILKHLEHYLRTLSQLVRGNLNNLTHLLMANKNKLIHPDRRLQDSNQKLDEYTIRLNRNIVVLLKDNRRELTGIIKRLGSCSPGQHVFHATRQLDQLQHRLFRAADSKLQQYKSRLQQNISTLNAISPLATLDRGYAIVSRITDKKIIRDSKELMVNDRLATKVAYGTFESLVTKID